MAASLTRYAHPNISFTVIRKPTFSNEVCHTLPPTPFVNFLKHKPPILKILTLFYAFAADLNARILWNVLEKKLFFKNFISFFLLLWSNHQWKSNYPGYCLQAL